MHPTDSNQTITPVKSVFLDIVGYSERNVELQKFVVSERDKIILAALDAMEVREGERVLNPIGDGLYVALLASPDKYDLHLRLALEILRRLGEYNQHAADPERFDLRIGIDECMDDLTTDINNKVNVVGDGANIASRIMGLADGGQILVSDWVHRQLFKRQQYEDKFRELPSKKVKHGVLVRPFQYVEEGVTGLNCDLPKEMASRRIETRTSNESADFVRGTRPSGK